jgi:hypothetical protein
VQREDGENGDRAKTVDRGDVLPIPGGGGHHLTIGSFACEPDA